MTFYTYLWLREDGTPYYVGKGTLARAHRKGSPPRDRVLLQEWPSETDAFVAEQFFIAFYGRKDLGTGILRNRTGGGEGQSGRIWSPSEETRRRMSDARIGKKFGPFSKEARERMSAVRLGHRYSPDTEIKKGMRLSPATEFKEGHTPWKGLTGGKHPAFGHRCSAETKRRMSEARKQWWKQKRSITH